MTELRTGVCPQCHKAHGQLEDCRDYVLAPETRKIVRDYGLNPRRYSGKLSNLVEQERTASALMQKFDAYATEIGCQIIVDEIICDEEQQAKLLAWWEENTS